MAGLISVPKITDEYNKNLNAMITPTATPIATPVTPVAGVVAPQSAPREIKREETVAGQLNTLLSKESPYIQSARTRGIEAANSRGLINSSLAAGLSERAAIDAAMPIATQDAATHAQSGLSAQQASQDIGLTGYKGLIDSAQKSEDFAHTTATNAQNIQANIDLQNSRIALDLSRLGLEQEKLSETQKTAVTTAMGPILQQLISEESKIQQLPDEQMSPSDKQLAIAELRQSAQTRAQTMASLYGYKLDWPANDASLPTTTTSSSSGAATPAVGNLSPDQARSAQDANIAAGLDKNGNPMPLEGSGYGEWKLVGGEWVYEPYNTYSSGG